MSRSMGTQERLTMIDAAVSVAALETNEAQERMGELLVQSGKMTDLQLEKVIRHQQEHGGKLGEVALALGFVSKQDIAQVLGRQFEFSFVAPDQTSISPRLHMAFNLPSDEQETIKALRSQIQVSWLLKGQRSLLVTGVDGDDEPAMVAANLAIAFSQSGKRTLLVDANMRSSLLHEALGVPHGEGLADLLAGRCRLASVVHAVPPLQLLSFLGCGTQVLNPQELLARDTLPSCVREMERDYDVIIFTTPTRADFADAQILSTAVPGALLLVRQDVSRIDDIRVALARFATTQARVLGCVYLDA